MEIKGYMEGEKLTVNTTPVECGVLITYVDSTEKVTTVLGFYFANGKIVQKEL